MRGSGLAWPVRWRDLVPIGARWFWWSPVRYFLPVFLGIESALVLDRGMPWRGEWAWTVDWPGSNVVILGPLLAGLAVWRTVSVRAGLSDSGEVMSPSGLAPLAELVGVIGWAWLAHGIAIITALSLTWSVHPDGVPDLLPLLPQFVHLAGYAGLGALLGALVPQPLMAPLTAITLLFAVTQFSAGHFPALWVYVGGATSSLVGLSYNPQVVLAQLVLGGGLFLLAFVVRRGPVDGLRVLRSAAIACGVPLAVAALWLAEGPDQYVPVASALEQSCMGEAPTVCVFEANRWAGPPLQHVFHALAQAARAEGAADLPARFEQSVPGQPTDPAVPTFVINSGSVTTTRADPWQAAHYFVLDRRCLSADASPPGVSIGRLQLLAEYLVMKAGLADAVPDPRLSDLMRSSPAHRAAWVVAALEASRQCRFADVPTPPGVTP